MRYSPQQYALAFADLASRAKTDAEQTKLIKDFWAAVERNGDIGKANIIAGETERTLARRLGRKHWHIESARKLSEDPRKLLRGIASPNDTITTDIQQNLVAGIRVTMNDERQFDGTLKKKLDMVFHSRTTG